MDVVFIVLVSRRELGRGSGRSIVFLDFREDWFGGRDFGYLVSGDGCWHDAEDFFWR